MQLACFLLLLLFVFVQDGDEIKGGEKFDPLVDSDCTPGWMWKEPKWSINHHDSRHSDGKHLGGARRLGVLAGWGCSQAGGARRQGVLTGRGCSQAGGAHRQGMFTGTGGACRQGVLTGRGCSQAGVLTDRGVHC